MIIIVVVFVIGAVWSGCSECTPQSVMHGLSWRVAACRAPYDNIYTAENMTLRARAAQLPPLAEGEVGFVTVRGPRRVNRSKGNAVDHTGPLGGIANG